jgi:hypothetical protein
LRARMACGLDENVRTRRAVAIDTVEA